LPTIISVIYLIFFGNTRYFFCFFWAEAGNRMSHKTQKISSALEEEFSFLFEKLSLNDTRVFVERYVKPTRVEKKKEDFL